MNHLQNVSDVSQNISNASQSENHRSDGRSYLWEQTFSKHTDSPVFHMSLEGLESARRMNLCYSSDGKKQESWDIAWETEQSQNDNIAELKFSYLNFQYAEEEMQIQLDIFAAPEKKRNLFLFTLFIFVEFLMKTMDQNAPKSILYIYLSNFLCLLISSVVLKLKKSFSLSKYSRKFFTLWYIVYAVSFVISNDSSEGGCFFCGAVFLALPVFAASISISPLVILVVQLALGLSLAFTTRTNSFKGASSAIVSHTAIATVLMISLGYSVEIFRNRKEAFETTLKLLSQNRYQKTQFENKAATEKISYIAQVAHDIGTPLTAISLSLDVLAEGDLTPEEVKDVVRRSKCALTLMKVTREDALDGFKLMSGLELTPNIIEVDLREILRKCANIMGTFEEKGQHSKVYKFFIDDWVPFRVMTDYNWVWNMLINYMSNATKYSSAGEIIVTVMIAKDPNFVRIEVSDKGIGIQEHQKHKIFKRFGQLQRGAGGTGLGLHGVYTKAKALGGQVGLRKNTAVDSGSVFWFEFPHSMILDAEKKALMGSLAIFGENTALEPLIPSLGGRFSATDRIASNAHLRSSISNTLYTKANVKFSIYLITTSQFSISMQQEDMEGWIQNFKTTQEALYRRSSCTLLPFIILILVEDTFALASDKEKINCTSTNDFSNTRGSHRYVRSSSKIQPSGSTPNFKITQKDRSRLIKMMRDEVLKQGLSAIVHHWFTPASEEECYACLLNTINQTLPGRCIDSFRSPDSTHRIGSDASEESKTDESENVLRFCRNNQTSSNCVQTISSDQGSTIDMIHMKVNSILKQSVPQFDRDESLGKTNQTVPHLQYPTSFSIEKPQNFSFSSIPSLDLSSVEKDTIISENSKLQMISARSSGRSGKGNSKMKSEYSTGRDTSGKRDGIQPCIEMETLPKENVKFLPIFKENAETSRIEGLLAQNVVGNKSEPLKTNRYDSARRSEKFNCNKISNMHVGCDFKDDLEVAPMMTIRNSRSQNQNRKKILVVEDELSILKFIQKLLGKKYTVETASNGFLGLNLMQHNAYHAVLMDLNMPVMDGFEAIERFRKWEISCLQEGSRKQKQVIIVCSANAHESHVHSALIGGADAFVTKPLKVNEVIDVIERLHGK